MPDSADDELAVNKKTESGSVIVPPKPPPGSRLLTARNWHPPPSRSWTRRPTYRLESVSCWAFARSYGPGTVAALAAHVPQVVPLACVAAEVSCPGPGFVMQPINAILDEPALHLRTVPRGIPSRPATTEFVPPSAQANTIRHGNANACADEGRPVHRWSASRSPSVSTTRGAIGPGIASTIVADTTSQRDPTPGIPEPERNFQLRTLGTSPPGHTQTPSQQQWQAAVKWVKPMEEVAMFVQMFTGKVTNNDAVRAVLEGWRSGPGRDARGWLGSTEGITDDGKLVALVRFESEEAARANSDRPEQGEWWESLAANLDGEASFFEGSDVDVDLVGDPAGAGFVQVMTGRVKDSARARELAIEGRDAWVRYRPDILASVMLSHDDGQYVMAVYFTSEAEAREGEKREPPEELSAQIEEMNALDVGEVTYFDLREPRLTSP